jgi:hypothetical protein
MGTVSERKPFKTRPDIDSFVNIWGAEHG